MSICSLFRSAGAAQANINPAQLNVLVGEPAYITCMATGTPPLTISWRYNGSPSLPSDAEVNGDVLVIDSVQLTHSGNYSCVVSNDLSTAEDNVELTVVGMCLLHVCGCVCCVCLCVL